MYSIYDYGRMFADGPRIRAYASALEQAIRPDSVVIDIGTGTGIFALLACRYGAARVYAIEPDDAIQVAAQIARENGYADRIKFIQSSSNQVDLPEQADVIVSDLRGTLPLYSQHIPVVMDARRRFLKPDGVLIPMRDTLKAALVTAPALSADYSTVWEAFGLDMHIGRDHAINTLCKHRPVVEQLLTAAQPFATLDYRTIESPNISGSLTQSVSRSGTAHGFQVWFDAEIADGLTFSNAPDQPELVYGEQFFPLEQAVPVEVGDQVDVQFRAKLIGEDYAWQWNTQIRTATGLHRFKQSTVLAVPLSPEKLRKSTSDYQPELNASGTLLLAALQHFRSKATTVEIAQLLFDEFRGQFADIAAARTYVIDLSTKYSR